MGLLESIQSRESVGGSPPWSATRVVSRVSIVVLLATATAAASVGMWSRSRTTRVAAAGVIQTYENAGNCDCSWVLHCDCDDQSNAGECHEPCRAANQHEYCPNCPWGINPSGRLLAQESRPDAPGKVLNTVQSPETSNSLRIAGIQQKWMDVPECDCQWLSSDNCQQTTSCACACREANSNHCNRCSSGYKSR